MDKIQAKERIKVLVEKYEAEKTASKISKYSEEETKRGFIEPLFEALGWDFSNKREVTLEEQISGDRVDYGFYLNGRIKFYLEAKSLKADLHRDDYAKQSIRYSWNKGVTWAVLTDFESVIVFNALSPEKSLAGKRYFEIPYNEYLDRFDQLWLLSKEAFVTDNIDKAAEDQGKKLQKVFVTEKLAEDLNYCRKELTEAFLTWNRDKGVQEHIIDEGVQKLLDRLIFIRVAEDRKIEPPTLIPLVHQWKSSGQTGQSSPYNAMIEKFRELDKIYDSNLFSPHPFEKWEEFSGATEKVINRLYGDKDYFEYDFSAIPADVLGAVYENYLGYKLEQTKKKLFDQDLDLAKDKRKRKEQGIYYTPRFIVDYIVQNALGPILDKCKSVNDLQKVKVLDPACGSGSFLVAAMNFIIKKYEEFEVKPDGFLKVQILQNNIYGVDLDEQAVEIARLNLLLNTFDAQTKLPGLENNIKNGNSLISGTDEELEKFFGKNYRDKKPFNWQEEFPEVFKQGGFDCVIGNPPYVRPEKVEENERNYFITSGHFDKFFGRFDIYILFIEKVLKMLNKNSYLSLIIPSSFFNQNYAKILRGWLLSDFEIENIEDLSDVRVFDNATVQSAIIVIKNSKPNGCHEIDIGRPQSVENIVLGAEKSVCLQSSFLKMPQCMIRTDLSVGSGSIIEKIKSRAIFLGDIVYVAIGIVPHDSKTGASKDRLISSEKSTASQKIYVEGKDIGRYKIAWRKIFLDYQPNMMHRPKFPELLENDKLFVRNISTKEGLLAFLDRERFYANDTVSICVPWHLLKNVKERGVVGTEVQINNSGKYNLSYLLALINSKLLNFYFKKILSSNLHVYPEAIRNLPIHSINFKDIQEKELHTVLSELAEKMLDLQRQFHTIEENSNEWQKIKDEITKTDKKIDEEVYKLYGLTEEEIKVVEEGSKK